MFTHTLQDPQILDKVHIFFSGEETPSQPMRLIYYDQESHADFWINSGDQKYRYHADHVCGARDTENSQDL